MNVPNNKVQWHLTNKTTRWHVFKTMCITNENFMVIIVNKNHTKMFLLYFTVVDTTLEHRCQTCLMSRDML